MGFGILTQLSVVFFLLLDIFSNSLFVSSYCRDIIATSPRRPTTIPLFSQATSKTHPISRLQKISSNPWKAKEGGSIYEKCRSLPINEKGMTNEEKRYLV
jgi:hypothetical protein